MEESVSAAAGVLAPRENPQLVGHENAERELRRLVEAGRLPHAILLSGPRGIGKATLAFRLARFLLAGPEESRPRCFRKQKRSGWQSMPRAACSAGLHPAATPICSPSSGPMIRGAADCAATSSSRMRGRSPVFSG